MKMLNRKILEDFWQRHPETEDWLKAWVLQIKQENWENPADVIASFPKAFLLKDNHVQFDIQPERYSFVIGVNFPAQLVIVKWISSLYKPTNLHEELLTSNSKEVVYAH